MIPGILIALFAAIAWVGAFTLVYNRWLCHWRDSLIKRVSALALLPTGAVLAAGGAWRLAGETSAIESQVWQLAALAGVAATVRQAWILRRHSLAQRACRHRWRPYRGRVISARHFSGWKRGLLRLVAPFNQIAQLRVVEYTLAVADLPPAFEGYRVVHVTDLHLHPKLAAGWYRHALDEAMHLRPDVVLFGGDFISRREHVACLGPYLRRLHAPDGVFFVRGNHDFWKAPRSTVRVAEVCGMRLLSNEGVVIERDGQRLALLGFESPYIALTDAERRAMDALPTPRLGLVHTPDAFCDAESLDCVVAFAGHTHGGQVRLPIVGAPITCSWEHPTRIAGIGRRGTMTTVVSNGIGSFFPLRVGAPPEVTVVVIVRE